MDNAQRAPFLNPGEAGAIVSLLDTTVVTAAAQ